MSETFNKYIGYWIKVKCEKCTCVGEIVNVNPNTIVLKNSSINEIPSCTKFLGINKTLIQDMDIIKPAYEQDLPNYSCIENNKVLNVYTSETHPPFIKRGGPPSAVSRNLLKANNTVQENIHTSRSSNFNENKPIFPTMCSDNLLTSSSKYSSNISDHETNNKKYRNYSKIDSILSSNVVIDENSSIKSDRRVSLSNNDSVFNEFITSEKIVDSSDFSDSSGINISFNQIKQRDAPISNNNNIDKEDFLTENIIKSKNEINSNKGFTSAKLTEGGLMHENILNGSTNNNYATKDKVSKNVVLNGHKIFHQPDIVQEVTKSQLSSSDLITSNRSVILPIDKSSQDFQKFSDFWKIENNVKIPVFSTQQRNKLFECANKFGYDIRTIADEVGKTLSEFVMHQLNKRSRLKESQDNRMHKIAVLLSRCQTSVFVASMARHLVTNGCYVLALFDNIRYTFNEDIDKEMKLLESTYSKYERGFVTSDVRELRQPFDYIVSGFDCDGNPQPPREDLLRWCFYRRTTIMCVNPPEMGHVPWAVAAFVGVPTCSHRNLHVSTRPVHDTSRSKPPPITYMHPSRLHKILVLQLNLPKEVYGLLGLSYESPFLESSWLPLLEIDDDRSNTDSSSSSSHHCN